MKISKIEANINVRNDANNSNFFDDLYSSYFIQHKQEVVRRILEIILNIDDLILDSVISQYTITNVKNRSIILDVLAKDRDNNIYNIEFQNHNIKGLNKRASYHFAEIAHSALAKSKEFNELPNIFVIFICNFDLFKCNEPLYEVDKIIKKNNKEYNDNQHTIFVNCKYKDTSTEIGKLIHDLTSNNTEEKWYNEFKEGQDIGGESMGEGLERCKNKLRQEGIKQSIQGMIRENFSNEIISRVCNVKDAYINKIRKEMKI